MIPLSWLTSRQTRLYRYLWRSVLDFDSVDTFIDRLYGAGFVDVEVRTVPGWQHNILHTFRAAQAGGSSDALSDPSSVAPLRLATGRGRVRAVRRSGGRASRGPYGRRRLPVARRDGPGVWSPAAGSPGWPRRSDWPSAASR